MDKVRSIFFKALSIAVVFSASTVASAALIEVSSMVTTTNSVMNLDLFDGGTFTSEDNSKWAGFGTANAKVSMNLCIYGSCEDGRGYELVGVRAVAESSSFGADTTVKAYYTGDYDSGEATYEGLLDDEYGMAMTSWTFDVRLEDTWLNTYLINMALYDFTVQSLYLYDHTDDELLLDLTLQDATLTCASTTCFEEYLLQMDHEYTVVAMTALSADSAGDYDNEPYTGFYFQGNDTVLVPEPTALWLFSAGLVFFGIRRKQAKL
jgi:hypothetical protein